MDNQSVQTGSTSIDSSYSEHSKASLNSILAPAHLPATMLKDGLWNGGTPPPSLGVLRENLLRRPNGKKIASRISAWLNKALPCLPLTPEGVEKGAVYIVPFILLVCYSLLASFLLWLCQNYLEPDKDHAILHWRDLCVDVNNVSFSRAFYFTSTVFLSIGYGDVIPCTVVGKLLTMVYACTGVPLTIFCLSRLGRPIKAVFEGLWFGVGRKLSLGAHGKGRKDSKEEERLLPLPLGVALTMLWVLLSALFFQFVIDVGGYDPDDEQPNKPTEHGFTLRYFNSLYFTIISLFTIGFGDLVPRNRNLDWLTFSFIFIGLSMVSMCVAIAQRRLESQFERLSSLRKVLELVTGSSLDLAHLDPDQQKLAALVLRNWSKENPGLLMDMEPEGEGRRASKVIGQFAQEAMMGMWQKKAAKKRRLRTKVEAWTQCDMPKDQDIFTISASLKDSPPDSFHLVLSARTGFPATINTSVASTSNRPPSQTSSAHPNAVPMGEEEMYYDDGEESDVSETGLPSGV